MNPTLRIWLQLFALLAVEIGVLTGLAALLIRFTHSAAWRRTIWQVCLLAALALLGAELTGIARQGIGAHPGNSRTGMISATIPDPETAHHGPISEDFRAKVHERLTSRQAVGNPSVQNSNPASAQSDSVPKAANRTGSAGHLSGLPDDSAALIGFVLIWLTGTALVLGHALLCRLLFHVLRNKWKPVAESELLATVQTLAQQIGLRQPIRLIESRCFASPIAFGIWRPTIGLPANFAGDFTLAQQDVMLVHELAHLWARDPAWRLVADVVTAALWWHPLSWWLRRQLQSASETAADEASLLLTNGPNRLAECLVTLGAGLQRRTPFGSLGMEGNGFRSGLGRRVARLVQLDGRDWSPPSRRRSALAKTFGPIGLVLAVVIGTAWAVPPALTKGENMQTMKNTWRRSVAALALLTALETDPAANLAQAQSTPPGVPAPTPATTPRDNFPGQPPTIDPAGTPPPAAGGTGLGNPAGATAPDGPGINYGLAGGNRPGKIAGRVSTLPAGGAVPGAGFDPRDLRQSDAAREARQAILAKLENIRLDNVRYDGIPLEEIVRQLVEITARRDTAGGGVNFVLDREVPPSTAIDPITGLPVAPAEATDLRSTAIHLDPGLQHVRLVDLLDAITKVADKPIKYSIEQYGVVFSLDQEKMGMPRPFPGTQSLAVRTFKVDTNTFFAGLQTTFGVEAVNGNNGQARRALKELLQQLGIVMDSPAKSIFYNDLTGIVMVRATADDLDVVEAAIETLGGRRFSGAPGMVVGGGFGLMEANPRTALPSPNAVR